MMSNYIPVEGNNDLVREKLGWDYSQTLEEGVRKTYEWINAQVYANQPMHHPV